ncbi:MAG: DUF2490 domain-containing protein [Microscillaceae bacterium]|nr:DUF2490 domain-containing protein [Microscillaceae bacterium]
MYLKKYQQDDFLCFVILLWMSPGLIFSQNLSKNVSHTNQQWIHYFLQAKVSEKWTLLADGSYRLREGFEAHALYLARVGVAYQLNNSVRLAAGFANLGTYGEENITRREYRPHQEVSIRNKFPRLDINHRFRLEERFFREAHPAPGEDPNNFNYRFRYQFLMNIPLVTFKASKSEKKLLLGIADEIFIQAGREIVYNVFDQNRVLISPTIQCNKSLSIALTYAYQFASQNAPNRYVHTDIYWLIIRHNIDLSPKHKHQKS